MTDGAEDASRPRAVRLGETLRTWRRLNNMKQAGLASLLGVSQPTVARWEQGADTPSPARMKQIRDLIAGSSRDELALERVLIQRQSGIRTLMDIDGLRLCAVSEGYRALWPEFSTLLGVPLADHVVNETRDIVHNDTLMHEIRRGSIGMISGISERQIDLDMDSAIKHRWDICLRRYGDRVYADISFEPYAGQSDTGIYEILGFDAFGDLEEMPLQSPAGNRCAG